MEPKIILFAFAFFFTTSALSAQDKRPESVVNNYFTRLDAGDLEAVVALLSEDFTASASFAPGVAFDKKAWRGVGANFATAFPGMKHEVVGLLTHDRYVVVDGIFKGTNTGPNMGNPPTGNKVELPFMTLIQIDGKGKMKSLKSIFDNKLFESQLMAGINPHATAEAGIRKAYAALEQKDFNTFASLCDPNFTELGLAPQPIVGVWNAIESYKPFLAAFPDIRFNIENIVPAGNGKYILTMNLTGTNSGAFMGIPPTGKRVSVQDMDIVVLNEKGLCVSHQPTNPDAMLDAIGISHLLDPRRAANEATVKAILAAADAGDGNKVVSYFATDAKHYFSGVANTNDELKMRVKGFKAGFPDIQRNFKVLSGNSTSVTVQGWLVGTNTGSFMGKPATGNKIKTSALGIYIFNEQGKVTEAWVELDGATLMNQLRGEAGMETKK